MNVCRICLDENTGNHKDISKLPEDIKESKTYADIMLFCFNIEILPNSKLSSKLCETCYRKVIEYYKFKSLALKHDNFLKSIQKSHIDTHGIIPNENLKRDKISNGNLYGEIKNNTVKVVLPQNVKKEGSFSSDNEIPNDEIQNIDLREINVKEENVSEDFHSDDELLSVIKKIKYEYIEAQVQETCNVEFSGKRDHSPSRTSCTQLEEEGMNSGIKVFPTIARCQRDDISKEKCKAPKKRKRLKNNGSINKEKPVCEICGKSVRNLKEHINNKHLPHGRQKKFKCKVCGKLFANHSAKYKHNKIKHLGIKAHCDICDKDFVNINSHRLMVHKTESLPFKCVLCERGFLSKSALEDHITIHTKHRPHKCDKCEKAFRTKATLQQHTRQVHEQEKSHLCQFCPKRFFKKYHLQVHLRSHLKQKPYKCDECGKFFSSCSTLKIHKLVHTSLKNYSCELCDMTFSRSSYLRNHMVSHTKERKYKCEYCNVLFGRSDHRLRHQRTVHKKMCEQIV